jgi:hypothetical protein
MVFYSPEQCEPTRRQQLKYVFRVFVGDYAFCGYRLALVYQLRDHSPALEKFGWGASSYGEPTHLRSCNAILSRSKPSSISSKL